MNEKMTAQERSDQIACFRRELEILQQQEILQLDDDQQHAISTYHSSLLDHFSQQFDIDLTSGQKQLSIGMRIASFLGALALSCSLFLFFYRIWGDFSLHSQMAILVTSPLAATALTAWIARKERTYYFTSLAALVALVSFILNLVVMGTIFNVTPSQNSFLVWGLFAFFLAYAYRLKLILVAGMFCLAGYLAATVGTWAGCYWLSFGERPENFIVAGAFFSLLPLVPLPQHALFAHTYRLFGLLFVFISVLILANSGEISYLPFSSQHIEYIYQVGGFILAAGVITLGIKKAWPGITNLGSTFFTLFLYTKLFDWWWDWLPRYLFFFLIGMIAILLITILKRLHGGRVAS